jgi:hypothetical protein
MSDTNTDPEPQPDPIPQPVSLVPSINQDDIPQEPELIVTTAKRTRKWRDPRYRNTNIGSPVITNKDAYKDESQKRREYLQGLNRQIKKILKTYGYD